MPAVIVDTVRFEHHDRVLGLGTTTPRLSWQVHTEDPAWSQAAYELELNGVTTVRVESSEQVLVPWPFEPLTSRARATVRVRVASGSNDWSDWSESATVEVGLLDVADWTARFISPRTLGGRDLPAPIMTRVFVLKPDIVSARLYATAHGIYTATLNGQRVGDEVLTPGWTSYHHRLPYQAYDVTALVREGENRLEALLGNGWFRGGPSGLAARIFSGAEVLYGDRLALLAQLEVTYADGSVEVMGTDDGWTAGESGVLENDLYDGQRTDLQPREPRVDAVEVLDEELGRLTPAEGPAVRVTDVLPAVAVFESPSGTILVDFGQNLAGWVRLRVRGARSGDEVTVRHAEVLENGELCVRPLQNAKATDTYVLAGPEELTLEPSLTFHGFRYAEISGLTELEPHDVEAVIVGSDLRRTGWFSCSDSDLERLHENVVWSMRANFLYLPTDCPQRAERLGWTGDIQVFAPTACFLFDTAGFLSSWLIDLALEQGVDGSVPWVVPEVVPERQPRPTAGWGDAATVVPWTLYQRYADAELLRRQFDSMQAWVDKLASSTTDGVWYGGFQFGDWLDPTAPPDDPYAAKAHPDVVATAYLARSADIVAEAARVLGHEAEALHYAELAEHTRRAFACHYVTDVGFVHSDAQAVYAMALEWALLPSVAQREQAGGRLADLIRANGFRIGTGFLGTPLICDALCAVDRADLAYRLLLERACPSWLYPVTMGATTIWERWDSMMPDGTVNVGEMVSFNHYALGAVADWMHRVIAGLAPAAPGYREITVRPMPHRSLTYASARHLTPYGEASVAWRREDGQFTVDVVVPTGARATIEFPGTEPMIVGHGRHHWTVPDSCRADRPIVTVRDLVDSDLWSAAADVLIQNGFGGNAIEIVQKAAPYFDRPALELPRVLDLGADSVGAQAHEALAKLIA